MALAFILGLVLFAGASSAGHWKSRVTLSEYSSIVQVEFLNLYGKFWSQKCAANILTTRRLLSAAHCFSGRYYNPQFRRVRAGANYKGIGGVFIYIDRAINHPCWSSSKFKEADITVVELNSALVYNPLIQRTVIPVLPTLSTNLPLVQVGWGRGEASFALSEMRFIHAEHSYCDKRDSISHNTAGLLCGSKFMSNEANGDIGGPWFFTNITVGIIAGANDFTSVTSSGVIATNVAYYTEWIVSVS